MPRRTQYELAKRNYHSVKYFPFPIESGAPFMLTSNPWNFLNTWLNNEIRKIQRTTDKSKRLEKSFIPKKKWMEYIQTSIQFKEY